MKQRKSKQVRLLSGMLIGIVMIAVLARIVYLNHCYPSPKVITYTENETIKLGNYETAIAPLPSGLLSSHDKDELENLSDVIYLVDSGRFKLK